MTEIIKKYLQRTGFKRFVPQVALFDIDGVLYDSMSNHVKAWQNILKKCGIKMSKMDVYRYEDMEGTDFINLLVKRQMKKAGISTPRAGISYEEARLMYCSKMLIYDELPPAKLIPGVHQLQEDMKAHGMNIGVVTGINDKALLNQVLQDFEGLVSPDIMVTARYSLHDKPAPYLYTEGMSKASLVIGKPVKPWQTIVVENSPLGVKAGVAAKCFTIAVNTGPLPDKALAKADIVLHSMDEVRSLGLWRKKTASRGWEEIYHKLMLAIKSSFGG